MYLALQAEFLAVIQIVVYSGAILILFVFVIALLSSGVRPFDVGPDRAPRIVDPGRDLRRADAARRSPRPRSARLRRSCRRRSARPAMRTRSAASANFGVALFTTNLLPFEVTAFILMVAVIGVVLHRRRR